MTMDFLVSFFYGFSFIQGSIMGGFFPLMVGFFYGVTASLIWNIKKVYSKILKASFIIGLCTQINFLYLVWLYTCMEDGWIKCIMLIYPLFIVAGLYIVAAVVSIPFAMLGMGLGMGLRYLVGLAVGTYKKSE